MPTTRILMTHIPAKMRGLRSNLEILATRNLLLVGRRKRVCAHGTASVRHKSVKECPQV